MRGRPSRMLFLAVLGEVEGVMNSELVLLH